MKITKWRLYIAVVVALLGPLQYGMALTALNTMLEPLSNDLGFDKHVGGAVAAAVMLLAGVVGGFITEPFMRLTGRYVQFWTGALYAIGWLLSVFASENKLCWGGPIDGCVPRALFAGRILVGVATAFARVVSPKYLADVAPPENRGAFSSSAPFFISVGVFLGTLIGIPYEVDDDYKVGIEWWRIMFLICLLPAVAQCVLSVFTFSLHGKSTSELRTSFFKDPEDSTVAQIPYSDVENSSPLMRSSTENPPSATGSTSLTLIERNQSDVEPTRSDFRALLEPRYRISVILGLGVPVAAQTAGVGFMSSFSTTIFKDAGMDSAVLATVLYSFVLLIGCCIPLFSFDTYGRKPMSLASYLGIATSFLCLALSDLAKESVSGPLSVVFVLLYAVTFGAGGSSITVAYAPEVVPPEIAPMVLGIGQALAVLFSFLLVLILPSVLDNFGAISAFLVLSGLSFGGLGFLKVYMVETKGRDLEEITADLTRGR